MPDPDQATAEETHVIAQGTWRVRDDGDSREPWHIATPPGLQDAITLVRAILLDAAAPDGA